MFDGIIYTILDKIVKACEKMKSCLQERSLPKEVREVKKGNFRKNYDKWKKSYK